MYLFEKFQVDIIKNIIKKLSKPKILGLIQIDF
jgi:hypothetical protein